MVTFAHPGLLLLLLLLPLFVILYIFARYIRKKRLSRFGDPTALNRLMPNLSAYKPVVKLSISLVALGAIIIAVARPWGGVKNQETSREGIEIVIAVDASNSMLASATGDEVGIDRMKMAKLVLEKLINRLGNDRVGLIAYAGDAYTLIPVTNDYVSAKAFLNSIDPTLIPHQGTNIGAAISLAERSFSDRGDIGKAIILLTDADELENPEGTVNEVKQASKRGIQTDVIGIGSVAVTIPSEETGRMIDEATGEVVRTALNEDLALEIAKAGNGIYVNAANNDAIEELVKQLGNLKKVAFESSFLVSHDELYFPFVILAIVLLIIDFCMTDKVNRWLDKINFFRKESAMVLLTLLSTSFFYSCGEKKDRWNGDDESIAHLSRKDSLMSVYSLPKERDFILRGNNGFLEGNLEIADSNYNAAIQLNNRSVVAYLNKGLTTVSGIIEQASLPEEQQISDSVAYDLMTKAVSEFENAARPKVKKNNVSSLAFYNIGNLAFIKEDYGTAIDNYKEALRLNPEDDHARRNLRIAQLKKKENDNNQQDKQQDQEDQQQEQQQDQQDQQPPQSQNQDRQQINEQTSNQILDAAERKENIRRTQIQTQNQESTEKSGRSYKKW